MLEPGDMVLADKGFAQIKKMLDNTGKNILMVMPLFLHNGCFKEKEVQDTFSIARVKNHIERIMQRIKFLK